jgi:lysozyme
MLLEVSPQGIALIKGFEQFRANAYWDAMGKVWTVGYGETNGVTRDSVVTEAEASQQLANRVHQDFTPGVLDAIPRFSDRMLGNELDALVSLAYNIGIGKFHGSTLAQLLNRGEVFSAAEEFAVWNKSGGQVLEGLVRRRAKEMRVFLVGY